MAGTNDEIAALHAQVAELEGRLVSQSDKDELAHGFNNFLTSILGNASILLKKLPADSPMVGMVEDIRLAATKAAALVDDILDTEADVPADAPAVHGARSAESASRTVLAVDDDPVLRSMARNILEDFGFEVLLAADGVEALEVFTKNDGIGLVVLDMALPRMSGSEIFVELRRQRGDLPILLASSSVEESVVQKLAGQGPAQYIRKPFRPLALVEKVQEMLGG